MAHPYNDLPSLELLMGADLTDELLDHDGDGTADVGHYDAVREEADREIDARLSQKYVVPFAAVTDTPDTPDLIKTLSDYLTAALLLVKRHPGDPRVEFYSSRAMQLMDGLLDGTYELHDGTKVSASASANGLHYESSDPVFGGADSSGKERMGSW